MTTQAEWKNKGEEYVTKINKMVAFGEKHGWENWKGKEPEDKRDHLADEVIQLLRQANKNNKVTEFRANYPPAHTPFIKYFQEKGQSIDQIFFIEEEKIVFLIGTAYQKRQAYILNRDEVIPLSKKIDAIGKSKQGNIFAVYANNQITTINGWQGEIIAKFSIKHSKDVGITQLIPFNDGLKVLSVTSEGIFLIDKHEEKMVHPEPDLEDEEWMPTIDMENATLSNDNQFIVVGDQSSDHIIFDITGKEIGKIDPQSSYPHFCLFSKDDSQLITNSCHFYNGTTIGVPKNALFGLDIKAYEESESYQVIDNGMRIYTGIATNELYILGDAFGYIRAIDKAGACKWRHFLGSTIGGIAISDDEQTLWVASCTGMIHKLLLGKGHRDKHTIGNGNHYEVFRLIMWKGEPIMKW